MRGAEASGCQGTCSARTVGVIMQGTGLRGKTYCKLLASGNLVPGNITVVCVSHLTVCLRRGLDEEVVEVDGEKEGEGRWRGGGR